MRLLDIHSHILPGVDDGSKNTETSIELLKIMKEQGITDVVATPHFNATLDNMDDYLYAVSDAYEKLKAAVKGQSLPDIHIGCEVYCFSGIGRSTGIRPLCIANSKHLLLELPNRTIDDKTINDIKGISNNLNIMPIIAHIERYSGERGFKTLLEVISSGYAYAQVNASSVIYPPFKRITHKLIKQGYITFIATDTHSPDHRPPLMAQALDEIENSFGKKYRDRFINNSERLYNQLT